MATPKRPRRRRTPKPLKPGTFGYAAGSVFEVDNNGRMRPRPDLGPGSGTFKHKYYKPPKR